MTIPESQRRWMKENTVVINARLTRNQDQDILDYLKNRPTATVIKAALREYMQNHPDE